jgi:hypothetical protein
VKLFLADPNSTPIDQLRKQEESALPGSSPLVKSILGALGDAEQKIQRLAFEQDPTQYSDYASIYQMKQRLLPDALLKRIAIQDDLVAAILDGALEPPVGLRPRSARPLQVRLQDRATARRARRKGLRVQGGPAPAASRRSTSFSRPAASPSRTARRRR